jgi:hypothetical protein
LGDISQAIEFYREHLILVRGIGDRRGEALTSWNLGESLAREGHLLEALPLLDDCVKFERELGHPAADVDAATVAYVRQQSRWPEEDVPKLVTDDFCRDIVAIACGAEEQQTEIKTVLTWLDQAGWQLSVAVQRIWAGERNSEALTQGIGANSAAMIRRLLELIDAPDRET